MNAALLTLSAVALLNAPAEPAEGPELLAAWGAVEGDAIDLESGGWLGLAEDDDGSWRLVEAELEGRWMDDVGAPARRYVDPGDDRIHFLIRGVAGAAAGPVAAEDAGELFRSFPLFPGESAAVVAAGDSALLTAWGRAEASVELGGLPVVRGYALTMQRGDVTQTLASMDQAWMEAMPAVAWAGDLDGDRALDLIVYEGSPHTEGEVALYLSSMAGEGELVGRAASFPLLPEGC